MMENILETAYTRNAIVHQCIKHGLSEAETLMWLEEGSSAVDMVVSFRAF